MAKKSQHYKVGFGKPPTHSRFEKGQSGNPRGRPKGSKNLATMLAKELNAPVIINENGQRKTITKIEAAVKQLVNKAASGDHRAMHQLFALSRLLEGDAGDTAAVANSRDADERVFGSILKRMQRNFSGDDDGGSNSI